MKQTKQIKQENLTWMRRIFPFLLAVSLLIGSMAVSGAETVQAAPKNRIVLAHSYKSLYVGESFVLRPKAWYHRDGRRISAFTDGKLSKDMTHPYFIFDSTNPDVLSVSKKGRVKARKKGSATITMRHIYDQELKAVIRLTVKEAPKKTKLRLKSGSGTVVVGKSVTIGVKKATGVSGKEAVFASGNKKVAVVNAKGVVTGKAAGTARITVTSALNKKAKASFRVRVITEDMNGTVYSPKGEGKIVLEEEEVTLAPYKSFDTTGWGILYYKYRNINDFGPDLNAWYKKQRERYGQAQIRIKSISGVDRQEVVYTSSDSTIAEVSSSGFVKPKRAGVAWITVTSRSDRRVKATYKVNVRNLVTGVRVDHVAFRLQPKDESETYIAANSPGYAKQGVHLPDGKYREVFYIFRNSSVKPKNADNKNMIVTSDNEDVIKPVYDEQGNVKLIILKKGSVKLTICSEDGFFKTTRNIKVADEDDYLWYD